MGADQGAEVWEPRGTRRHPGPEAIPRKTGTKLKHRGRTLIRLIYGTFCFLIGGLTNRIVFEEVLRTKSIEQE